MITYTRIITDTEQKLLEHDLINITAWIDAMIAGKISACQGRAAQAYDTLAKIENLASVPTLEADKAAALFIHPNYKNRSQRED